VSSPNFSDFKKLKQIIAKAAFAAFFIIYHFSFSTPLACACLILYIKENKDERAFCSYDDFMFQPL